MTAPFRLVFAPAGRFLRSAVAWLLAGLSATQGAREIATQLAAQPPRDQVVRVGGVLVALALLSVIFAQAGWVGLLAFWGAVVFVAW